MLCFRLGWYSGIICLTAPLQTFLRNTFAQRSMNLIAGLIFLGLSLSVLWGNS